MVEKAVNLLEYKNFCRDVETEGKKNFERLIKVSSCQEVLINDDIES
jgi:hypothetical protein